MYKTFIQPHFTYAIEAWGHTVQTDSDILVKYNQKFYELLSTATEPQMLGDTLLELLKT